MLTQLVDVTAIIIAKWFP